ncbi:hypothetical protein Dsin_020914 [Dipteronia sinensis]|uniref:HAT C-terminal dimerisation domain-containing protein n=1 Tax=Dipteronia sinensis TaxID=43782 RepID=A0AAE0ABB9_9ROSI|nr:hypothetical protein Dsin_020914 [Dipteronia sinensis]
MASGGDDSSLRNLDRGKGPLQDLLEHEGEEEKPLKSDLFKTHMKKTELDDGTIKIKCNYCPKTYKTSKNFGYGTYWAHIRKNHPSEMVKASRVSVCADIWTDNFDSHHYIAIIAKQILGTPVSTVAVEQEFSAGGNILEPRRSVLCPQSLEAQACVDDWTKAKFRQQELEPEIVNDFFEDDQTTGTEGSE